jgi:hypothetical protein
MSEKEGKRKHHRAEGEAPELEQPPQKKIEQLHESEQKLQDNKDVIEFGHVLFLYRPKVTLPEGQVPEHASDVQRLGMLMHPESEKNKVWRMMLFGKKQLPTVNKHEIHWALLRKIYQDDEQEEMRKELFEESSYETKTRGTRTVQPMRVCGLVGFIDSSLRL